MRFSLDRSVQHFFVPCPPKRYGIAPIDRSTCDRRARSFSFSREKSIIVLDLEKRPNVGTTNGTDEAMMVFLEESRMIFADMRLHATSTPTSTPTRYHHQKYRAQNNNNCTATARFFSDKLDNKLDTIFISESLTMSMLCCVLSA